MANDTTDFELLVNSTVADWAAANYPTMPIQYPNGPLLEESKAGQIFLDLEVRWYGSGISAIGKRPPTRHSGALAFYVYGRAGQGGAAPSLVLDSLIELLRTRRLGKATLQSPERGVLSRPPGWTKYPLFVPFLLDSA